jgi:LuxR family maltose regulon positive regulatory protein
MRVEQLLDAHPDRRVILVRGPAGAGKTVLVAQWVTAQAKPCAWLSIDAVHNDPALLLWHLIEVVERLAPNAFDATACRSAEGKRIEHGDLWDVLDLVVGRLGTSLTLVLDDVGRLHHRAAQRVIGRLVERPPQAVRVVLISRSKPQFGLERARLRGDLVEVVPAALRFQRSEIEELASTWTGRRLDHAELEQATLGWAAGLRLAQLEASAPDRPALGLRAHDGIASEYIREELIDGSPDELRSFLEVSCWLPVLTGPLCAAVLGQQHRQASSALPDMEALPVLPVASRPGAFRYPRILARALQQEYCRRDARAALSARRRAAEACRRAGELVTSISLFLGANCPNEAADVCAELAAAGESALRAVDELLCETPELAPEGPRWLPWRTRAAVAAGRVEEARLLLGQSRDPGEATDRDLLIAQAVVAEHIGDVASLLACAGRLLALVERTGAASGSDPQALGWRIRGLGWSGAVDEARAVASVLARGGGGSTPEDRVGTALARAWVAWFDGDIPGVADLTAQARDELGDDEARSAELALLAGSAHRERNQLAKAMPLIQEARDLAAKTSHHIVAALAASELARCQRAAGATMEALELVVSTRTTYPRLPAAVDAQLRSTEARVRLDQGDVGGAHAALRGADPGIEARLLAARIALQDAPPQAQSLLQGIEARTPRQAVEKLLLQAQQPDADPGDRSASLTEAISAGRLLGMARTFLDEGPTVNRALSRLALESSDPALGHLAALASQELALGPSHQTNEPIEQLTPRELAVLRMLPLRMSNREMAAQMYISVNTLKTHIRAIYRKLDVPHRSAAVRRAKALQLV